ncbi:MAG: BF3164 family lipoprotein [Longimicrobiales bacterium]
MARLKSHSVRTRPHSRRRTSGLQALWLLTVFLGCEPADSAGAGGLEFDPSAAEIDHAGLRVTSLSSDMLSSSPAIGQPIDVQPVNGYVWIRDALGDPALHVLDLRNGELLRSVGRRGEGPGEFLRGAFGLLIDPADSSGIWAWDLGLQRLTRFEARPGAEHAPKSIRLDGIPGMVRVAWVAPDRIVGHSTRPGARFALFSPEGERLRNVPGALYGSGEVPLNERVEATSSGVDLCAWPGRGFVVVNASFGRIDYFDLGAAPIRSADVPFPSQPRFITDDRTRQPQFAPERSWYMDCSVARGRVYALFSGRLHSAYESWAERDEGRFVHVFDWDGSLVDVYRLETAVAAIGVDPDGTTLIATSMDDAAIYRFELPR